MTKKMKTIRDQIGKLEGQIIARVIANSDISIHHCGPQSEKRKCRCGYPEGTCEHIWNGPSEDTENSSSVTCSKCGLSALQHDLWVMP